MNVPVFREFAATILDERSVDGIRGIASERNRFSLHIDPAAFAAMPLPDIRSRHIRAWVRDMSQKDAADTRGARKICDDTVKRSLALVSSVLTAAHERELVETNQCLGVKVKKRADASSTREKWTFLTLDEQKEIAGCSAIPYPDRLAIRFAIATGLRQGEQFALELRDLHVDGASPHVFVRFGKPGLPPKSGKTRSVPLFGDGIVVAREWLAELQTFAPSNPRGLMFPYAHGAHRGVGKPLGRGPLFREHLGHVGITRRVRWHDLRHTFCTNLVTGALGTTWPLVAVKAMAGHSSVTITERYAHVGQRDLVDLGAASAFSHGPMPVADTQRDLSIWFDEAGAA